MLRSCYYLRYSERHQKRAFNPHPVCKASQLVVEECQIGIRASPRTEKHLLEWQVERSAGDSRGLARCPFGDGDLLHAARQRPLRIGLSGRRHALPPLHHHRLGPPLDVDRQRQLHVAARFLQPPLGVRLELPRRL